MKKIIIPLDFSSHSEYALKAGALIAKKYGAEIFALHMLELSSSVLTESDQEHQTKAFFYLKLAEKKLEDFLDKDFMKDIKVTPIVKHYKVFRELNEVAKEIEADLIIMGSKGASGMKELFVGSNTEKVVRYSDIPVLVVKNELTNVDFEDVVFASDFVEESIPAYLKAVQLFKTFNSKMHLLYVNRPAESFKSSSEIDERIHKFLLKADGNIAKKSSAYQISDYTVEQGVFNFSNLMGADLIAVVTHGRTGVSHFFEGSVSESITNHTTLPVMTFKI